MRKYGIFWLPSGAIKEIIERWKQRVREVEFEATYVAHPVHTTFFLLMAEQSGEKQLIEELERFCTVHSPVKTRIEQWHVFSKDAAAGGGDTLVACLSKNHQLMSLQQYIADAFSPLRCENVNYPVTWAGSYSESFHKWGFPFVGEHWMPHISVGAVHSEEGRAVVHKALEEKMPEICCDLSAFALVRIEGEEHTVLHNAELKNAFRDGFCEDGCC